MAGAKETLNFMCVHQEARRPKDFGYDHQFPIELSLTHPGRHPLLNAYLRRSKQPKYKQQRGVIFVPSVK